MPRYNHAFDVAFDVHSDHSGSEDDEVPASELRKALQRRLDSMSDCEIVEACGTPFDTVDEEEDEPKSAGG